MPNIVIASNNAGKCKEIQHYFQDMPLQWDSIGHYSSDLPEESGTTFIENAIIKARFAATITDKPALADDSGLCIDALYGRPGLYSARYAGEKATNSDNIQMVLDELKEVPFERRTARFVCVLVYLRHGLDPDPIIASGYWQGKILQAPKGEDGFGYDPIFYVPEKDCAAAELSLDIKNRLSHRAKALEQLKAPLLHEIRKTH